LSAIEMENQLRLSLTSALSTIDPVTGDITREAPGVSPALTRIAQLRRSFLQEADTSTEASVELLHFNLDMNSQFRATALRLPGMLQWLPLLLAATLIGMTVIMESKRRSTVEADIDDTPDFYMLSDAAAPTGPVEETVHGPSAGQNDAGTSSHIDQDSPGLASTKDESHSGLVT